VTRQARLYLEDIRESIERVQEYVAELTEQQFREDRRTQDAVVRRLEIIGEAVKHLPESLRAKHTDVPWSQISGARDILVHEYFRVDLTLTWAMVTRDLPELQRNVREILQELG